MYQTVIKYISQMSAKHSKWPQNISIFSNLRLSNNYTN
jgi:hypothetical protein